MNNYIYTEVIGPFVKTIYGEVMIIGLFFVGFSYLRGVLLNREIVRFGYFWRQLVLLVAVMLFSTYIILAYNFDTAMKNVVELSKSFLNPKAFFLLMAPLELFMVGIAGAMFIVLSKDFITKKKNTITTETDHSSKTSLTFLFGVTGLWHLCCILWWLLWLGDKRFSMSSTQIHALIALVHFLSFFIWRLVSSSKIFSIRKNLCEWIGVLWYLFIIVAVYFLRICWYTEAIIKFAKG